MARDSVTYNVPSHIYELMNRNKNIPTCIYEQIH